MTTTAISEQNRLILVVDDDDDARGLLVSFLENNGYRTAIAKNGRQAISQWEVLAPNLILMDANMPVMDGIQACAEISGRAGDVKTSVLMVTVMDSSESVEKAFMAGAEEYVTKPIHWPVLKHRIRKILERQDTELALRSANEEMENRVLERTRELVQVNEALYISEDKFRSLVDASPDTILILDQSGAIRFCNHLPPGVASIGLTGYRLINQLPLQSQPRLQLALQRVFGQLKTDSFQAAGPQATWWSLRFTPLINDDADIPHSAMVIITDRTEQHNTQAQAIRNARLATVGTLAASVAHEINNPNNAILLQTSWLAKAWLGFQECLQTSAYDNSGVNIGGRSFPESMERFSEFLTGIIKNSKRIGTIVSNLKQMSKPDDGRVQESINIHKVFESVMSILANQINKDCAAFQLDLAAGLPNINGNLQQLEQVFINLILNALQSLPDTKRKIQICAWHDREVEKIVVTISDEGVGIPKENLEKIFQPFFTTKLDKGGTGLGLAVCQSIISKHNGCLEVESTVGEGTSVRVNFPCIRFKPPALAGQLSAPIC